MYVLLALLLLGVLIMAHEAGHYMAARACGIEVEVAMIGMQKQVGDEEVVVPHEPGLEVMPDAVQCGLGEVRMDDVAVEQLYAHIDAGYLGSSPPVTFLSGKRPTFDLLTF